MQTCRAASLRTFTLALAITVSGAASSQDAAKEAKIDIHKLMLVDGPYELSDTTGVFGFVVARSGNIATFRPCTGPMINVDEKKLRATKSTCEEEAPTDGNPLNVGCAGGVTVSSKLVAAIAENAKTGTAGTTIELGSNSQVNVMASYDDATKAEIQKIDRISTCGSFNIGFDAKGTDLMHFLSTEDAKSGAFQNLQ